jgi:glycosyltransferase involved in cell wall biosynthesis
MAHALPVCIAAHNVEWEIWSRTAATERRPAHHLLFSAQTALMRRFEQRVFSRFGHATAVSTGDAARIADMGCTHVTVVPNGVDATLYMPSDTDDVPPRSLVFSGSMDWRANQDAIQWFIDEVHPLLVAQGDYQFHVVGRSPPSWLQDPARVPRQVVVTGAVDRVQPYIANAAVYVVPLRVGGGSRLKILEALSMGRAVVSTAVGAEGLDVTPGVDIVIADSAADFAAATEALWRDQSGRQRLGAAGRALIERQYRWEQIAPLQAAAWRAAIAG